MLSLVIHMKVSIIAEKVYKQLIYSPYEKHQIKHFTVYIYTILSLKYSINYEKSEQKRVNNHYCLSVRDSSYVKVTIIASSNSNHVDVLGHPVQVHWVRTLDVSCFDKLRNYRNKVDIKSSKHHWTIFKQEANWP